MFYSASYTLGKKKHRSFTGRLQAGWSSTERTKFTSVEQNAG